MKLKMTLKFDQKVPKITEPKELMREMARKIHDDIKKNLRNQHSHRGKPFAPLAQSTIRRKLKKGSVHPYSALFDKGIMNRAIYYASLTKNRFIIYIRKRGEPTRDVLAGIHQYKGVNKVTKTKRPFFGLSLKLKKWIDFRVRRWIKQKLNDTTTHKVEIRKGGL